MPRFRRVATEIKGDGSPVTEADRAAERALREVLSAGLPEAAITGEELGAVGDPEAPLRWVIDPIDGTLAFSRGIPLFGISVALVEAGIPVLGMIDLPALRECYLGWRGGGCWRDGERVYASQCSDLAGALISHGDPECFERAGERAAFLQLAERASRLRGYTDVFGHAQVLTGGVDAMIDLDLSPWDVAATAVLAPEAGARCATLHYGGRAGGAPGGGKLGLVLGAPALVEQLLPLLQSGRLGPPLPILGG